MRLLYEAVLQEPAWLSGLFCVTEEIIGVIFSVSN